MFLDITDAAYHKCPETERDKLTWASLQYLQCMYHFCTSEFARSEREMTEGLKARCQLLTPDNLLLVLAYSSPSMAVAAQERYEEGLELLLRVSELLDGPAGEIPTRRLVWEYNMSRNYYCLNRFEEAEKILQLTQKMQRGNRKGDGDWKPVKVPVGLLARYTHAYSKALAMDPSVGRNQSINERKPGRCDCRFRVALVIWTMRATRRLRSL